MAYIAMACGIIAAGELKMMWKIVVMAYLKTLSQHMPGGSE
jgi:hypothetical protein